MGKIFNEINALVKDNYRFFTTPGHKQGEAYKNSDLNLLKYDLTEVQGLDNIHNPTECIKDSLKYLSEFYESKKSYYLLNGSTSGIHIMLFSCFNEHDEVLVERGCHKSLVDAMYLRKLKVNFINRELYNIDLLLPNKFSKIDYNEKNIILNLIKEKIKLNPKIKGVILTNPNYYGFYINQKEIYEYLKEKNIFLLIDSAHGAHIKAFNKNLNCPNKYCDISVMSAHKTLATFTQGAFLHVNNLKILNKVNEYFSIFTTTSPSYLTMLSLEKSVEDCIYNKDKGKYLIDNCKKTREFINNNTCLHAIDDSYIKNKTNRNFSFDDTRLCLKYKNEYINSEYLYKFLFNEKIVCEMSYFNGIVLIPSVYTKNEDFKYFREKIIKYTYEYENSKVFYWISKFCEIPYTKIYDPYQLEHKKYKLVKIKNSINRVLFSNIFVYPPGSPLIFKGEKILKEQVKLILEYIKLGFNINGIINNEYIKVVEE